MKVGLLWSSSSEDKDNGQSAISSTHLSSNLHYSSLTASLPRPWSQNPSPSLFYGSFPPPSHLNLTSLPMELIFLIIEYTTRDMKDLVRFGCICRSLRYVASRSPPWSSFQRQLGQANTSSTSTNQLDNSLNFSATHLSAIRRTIQHRNEQRNVQRFSVSLSILVLIWAGTMVVSSVIFGIKWKIYHDIIYLIGFSFVELVLLCSILFLVWKRKYVLMRLPLSLCLLLITLCLIQYKLSVSSTSLLWIEIMIPTYISIIMFYYHVNSYSESKWEVFLFPTLSSIPPAIAATLYCLHLDSKQDTSIIPYHPSTTIYLMSIHLSVGVIYFLVTIYEIGKTIKSLRPNVGNLAQDQLNLLFRKRLFFISMILVCVGGLVMTTLVILQAYPHHRILVLSENVNFVFYTLWIFLCVIILELSARDVLVLTFE